MRRLLLILFLFAYSCAPLVCPEGEEVKKRNSSWKAPEHYSAQLSIRYGFIRVPLTVEKREGRFMLASEGRSGEVSLNNLCFGGACLEVPIDPDGLIFGKVLRGDEKVSCSASGLVFERDEGPFVSRFIFKDQRLSLAEFYDKKKERAYSLSYLDWAKEGYVKALRFEGKDISLLIVVDRVKF